MGDEEYQELLELSSKIEDELQDHIVNEFEARPFLPGYGIIKDTEYKKYDITITFSLNTLYSISISDPDINLSHDVALIFTSEIMKTLFIKVLGTLSLNNNTINVEHASNIISYAKLNEAPNIILGKNDLDKFTKLDGFTPMSLKNYVSTGEVHLVGMIDNVYIFYNPLQELSDNSIYLLTDILIDYDIDTSNGITSTYSKVIDDVQVTYNAASVLYKQSANLDSINCFNINEINEN